MVDILLVKTDQARTWLGFLRKNKVSSATVAKILSVWRCFYRWLQHHLNLECNPLDGVKSPKYVRALPRILTVSQMLQLITYGRVNATFAYRALTQRPHLSAITLDSGVKQVQIYCVVEMLYGSGLRIDELLSLDALPHPASLGWIDMDSNEVHVTGKGDKKRTVPMGPHAKIALLQWLDIRIIKLKTLIGARNQAALFIGVRGGRLTSGRVGLQLKELGIKAGLDVKVNPHMLRHSFATHILASSGNLRAVQDLLGHTSIRSTQIYTHLDITNLKQIYHAHFPRGKVK